MIMKCIQCKGCCFIASLRLNGIKIICTQFTSLLTLDGDNCGCHDSVDPVFSDTRIHPCIFHRQARQGYTSTLMEGNSTAIPQDLVTWWNISQILLIFDFFSVGVEKIRLAVLSFTQITLISGASPSNWFWKNCHETNLLMIQKQVGRSHREVQGYYAFGV